MSFQNYGSAPRYQQSLYLGDLASRKSWAEKKPTIEIEVVRDGNRVKRQGILSRASGGTIFVGVFCYAVDEILKYRLVSA